MSNRVLCKFFAHGACLKGDYCEFAHDWKASPNNICTYYQKGACAYGNRCRYDHIRLPRSDSSASFSSSSTAPPVVDVSLGYTPEFVAIQAMSDPFAPRELTSVSSAFVNTSEPAWSQRIEHFDVLEDSDVVESACVNPADRALCSFAAAGSCPRGDKCPHIHGNLCSTCGKHCLHPFRPNENEEHKLSCEKRQKHLNALKQSQDIECSVCLERVLSKPTASERKFGLLSECDHPFCISCIRNWRSSSPSSGMDVNSALRSCPICRKLSYFVIPSVMWYFTIEEKQEIVDNYKSKLKSIDCKHFDFGSGSCPFGSSCFYKHAYRDGRLEEVVLRHLGAADGDTVIAKDIRLSDFLSGLHIR